jgi:hypothetical protein
MVYRYKKAEQVGLLALFFVPENRPLSLLLC